MKTSPATLVIPRLLGLLLLTAGSIKGFELASELSTHSTFPYPAWLLFSVAGCELFLGLWLLSGLYTRQARFAGLACFTCLFGVSVHQALSGQVSCGCFGSVPVKPWHAALVDLAALVALWRWQPGTMPSRTVAWRFALLVIGALLPGVSGAIAMSRLQSAPALSGKRALTRSAEEVDLGTVLQRGRVERIFSVRNPTDTPVEIATIETSCPCLTIEVTERIIAASGEVSVRAILDLSSEPSFTGDLGLEANGLTAGGKVVFFARLKASVRSGVEQSPLVGSVHPEGGKR